MAIYFCFINFFCPSTFTYIFLNFPLENLWPLGDADSTHDFKFRVLDPWLSYNISLISGIRVWAAPPSNCRKRGKEYREKEKAPTCTHVPFHTVSRRNNTDEQGSMGAVCSLRPGPWSYSYVIFTPNPRTSTEHAGGIASCSCAIGHPHVEWDEA